MNQLSAADPLAVSITNAIHEGNVATRKRLLEKIPEFPVSASADLVKWLEANGVVGNASPSGDEQQ